MVDDPTRRRALKIGACGWLAGLAGCLRLNEDGDEDGGEDATPAATTAAGDSTAAPTDDTPDDGTETASDPSTRTISGPSTVTHAFVDAGNRMTQRDADAPDTAPVVDWRQDAIENLNTRVFSTPVVAASTFVVSSFRDTLGFALADGRRRWALSESTVDDYRFPTGLSARDGAVLFAAVNERTDNWEFLAVDAADGSRRWRVELSLGAEERVRAATVDGDRAVLVTGTQDDAASQHADVVTVDVAAQSVAWSARLADAKLNPEDLAVDGDTLLATTDEAADGVDNVVAFDLGDRARRWSEQFPIGEAVPVLGDDRVYLPTDPGVDESGFSGVRALSRADGSADWWFELGNPPRTGVTVDGSGVYAVSGNKLYALDAATGDPRWSYSPDADPRISGSSSPLPVATSDHLLLGSDFGDDGSVVRAVSKAGGDLAWSVELAESTAYSPFVVGDHLYALGYENDDDAGSLYALH